MRAFTQLALTMGWPTAFAQQIDVNGYSAAVIPGFEAGTVDTFQLVPAIRSEAKGRGVRVYADLNQVPTEERAGVMAVSFSYSQHALGAELYITIIDVATGTTVGSASKNLVQWGTRRGFGQRLAREVWDEIAYRGFEAEAYERNLESRNLISPESDRFGMTEDDAIRHFDDNLASLEPIEGIWTSIPVGGATDTLQDRHREHARLCNLILYGVCPRVRIALVATRRH